MPTAFHMEFLRHFQSCKELKQNNLFYIGENSDLKVGDLHAQIHVETAYGRNVQVKDVPWQFFGLKS